MSISRRKLFGGVAAIAAAPIIPAVAEAKKVGGMEVVATFDRPVTAITMFRGNLIVAVDNKIYFYDQQDPTNWNTKD